MRRAGAGFAVQESAGQPVAPALHGGQYLLVVLLDDPRRVSVSTSSVIPGAGRHAAVNDLLGGASALGQVLARPVGAPVASAV